MPKKMRIKYISINHIDHDILFYRVKRWIQEITNKEMKKLEKSYKKILLNTQNSIRKIANLKKEQPFDKFCFAIIEHKKHIDKQEDTNFQFQVLKDNILFIDYIFNEFILGPQI